MKKAFINSLPKAGTNLLAQCLVLFGYRDKRTLFGEKAGIGSFLVQANTIPSYIRRILWMRSGSGYRVGIDSPVVVPKRPIDRLLSSLKDGQFMFGHVGYDVAILEKLNDLAITPFLVVRDPRAILSSFVNYVLRESKHPFHERFKRASLQQCYHEALYGISENNRLLMPLAARCESIAPWVDSDAVTVVKFEHLVGIYGGGDRDDQINVLSEISEVLELDTGLIDYVSCNVFGPGRATFSKGNVNSWQVDIPSEIMGEAETVLQPILEKWSYI